MAKKRLVETFFLVDFDRYLGNVDAAFNLLIDIVREKSESDAKQISFLRHQVESSGGSFNALSHLIDGQANVDLSDIERIYIERSMQSDGLLLETGAADFIEYLRFNNHSFCIMTYGDPRWQKLKINAAGLGDLPVVVASSKQKGKYVASWLNSSGDGFVVPAEFTINGQPVIAKEVCLIDDKVIAFEGLPIGARGYLVNRSSFRTNSGNESLNIAPTIKVVGKISDIVRHESKK